MSLHIIDRAALTALGAAGFYLLFLNAGAGVPLSAALAFGGMALARRLYARAPRKNRFTAAQAEAAVRTIARMPDGEALAALRAVTGCDTLVPALRYPGHVLSADEVFQRWREHRDSNELTLAATCPAGADARRAAAALHVTLIDSRALARRIRMTGQFVPPDAPPPSPAARLRRACIALLDQPPSARAALYGLSLLAMYLITGLVSSLVAAMIALAVTGARWIHQRT